MADSVAPAPGRGERAAFAVSVIFLFVAPFAASGGIRATCLIIAALAIAGSGAWKKALGPGLPRATLALVLSWFVLALLSLAWTVDVRHTLDELRAETFYGALAFAVFFFLAHDAKRWKPWALAMLAGTLIAFVAKTFHNGFGLTLWRHSPDGGPGAFSTHLVIVSPLLVALVADRPWGARRNAGFLAATLAALFVAAWSTRESWTAPNRSVWPALAVVFLVAIVAGRKAHLLDAGAVPGIRRVIAAGAIAMTLAFVASIAAKNERYYPNEPGIVPSVERDLRPRLWSLGWAEWKAAPLLGHGFGREIRASTFLPETPQGVDHPPLHHAHNALLNIGMQLGWVGALLFVAVLVALSRNYVAALAHPGAAALGVIGLALLAGFVTKNVTDDFLHRHNAQVFWALNGMLLGFASRARPV